MKQTYVRLNDQEVQMLEELRQELSKESLVELKNSDTIRFAIKKLHAQIVQKG